MKTTELLYYAINALPAPLWLAWIVAPRSRLARSFAQALWPWAILAALYVLLIGSAMFVFRGPPGADMLLYLALRSKLRGQGGAPRPELLLRLSAALRLRAPLRSGAR